MTRQRSIPVLLVRIVPLLALVTILAPVAAQINGQPASSVLGQSNFSTGNPGSGATGFDAPAGLAVDPATGKLFVADTLNNRVLRFSSAAALATNAPAEVVLGQSDFNSGDPGTSATTMNSPTGVAVDVNGRLWVADSSNNRVLGFDSAATKSSGAAADIVLGQTNFTSQIAATTQTGMNQPYDVAVDNSGRLWVIDLLNTRVLRFDAAQSLGNGAPANGVLGQPNFVSSTTSLSPGPSNFSDPLALAADNTGNLWIADSGFFRVLRFNGAAAKPNGGAADAVLGQVNLNGGDPNSPSSTSISGPDGLAIDAAGSLWVADLDYNRVLRFRNAAGAANNAAADLVLGQPNFTSVGPGLSRAGINGPWRVATAGANIWIGDFRNNRVLRFSTDASQIPPFGRSWLPLIGR